MEISSLKLCDMIKNEGSKVMGDIIREKLANSQKSIWHTNPNLNKSNSRFKIQPSSRSRLLKVVSVPIALFCRTIKPGLCGKPKTIGGMF